VLSVHSFLRHVVHERPPVGAVGLMASAHLLAAGRFPGMLEIDANHNPLRTELFDAFPVITDGGIRLPDTPGLGGEPDLRAIEKYRVAF